MLTQRHLLLPLTSTVKSSSFAHVHFSPPSSAARFHPCHANCTHFINNGWTFSGQTSYVCTLYIHYLCAGQRQTIYPHTNYTGKLVHTIYVHMHINYTCMYTNVHTHIYINYMCICIHIYTLCTCTHILYVQREKLYMYIHYICTAPLLFLHTYIRT